MHSEPPVEKKFPIQRKLRALWNRLSEGNAETIAKNLENLLTSLSEETEKEEFHSSLVTLLLESLNNHSSLVSSVHPVSVTKMVLDGRLNIYESIFQVLLLL